MKRKTSRRKNQKPFLGIFNYDTFMMEFVIREQNLYIPLDTIISNNQRVVAIGKIAVKFNEILEESEDPKKEFLSFFTHFFLFTGDSEVVDKSIRVISDHLDYLFENHEEHDLSFELQDLVTFTPIDNKGNLIRPD